MSVSQFLEIRAQSLAQLAPLGTWQLELAHDRPEHLLIWITRGHGRVLLNGAHYGFGPGTTIFIPANNLFALDAGRQTLGNVLAFGPTASDLLPTDPTLLRNVSAQTQAELTGNHDAILHEQERQPPFWTEASRAHARLAAIILLRTMPAHSKQSAAHRLIRRYSQAISASFQSGAAMADYATDLNVTAAHLTRVCRAQTGRTAAALLNERIAHAARSRLMQTPETAKTISAELGFSSASSFNRFVLKQFGKPPGALRKF